MTILVAVAHPSLCNTNDETFPATEGPVGGPPGYLELSQALVQSACWKAREVDRETVPEDIKRVAEEELSPGRLRKQRAFLPDKKK